MGKAIKLVSLISAHLFLVSRLIFFPYPELFIYPYLTNIGLTPYSQIFDQHFPGLMFLPINLGTLGFDTVSEMMILHLSIIAITHILIFITVKQVTKSEKTAFLANLFYFLWQPYLEGNTLWIDSFIPLLFLPASLFFYNKKYSLSGLFLGFALVMKQVVVPLGAVLGLYLLVTKQYQALKSFAIWSALPVLAMLLYIVNIGAWNEFFYWTVTFNLTTFAEMGRKYATLNELIKIAVIFSPAIIYSIYLLYRKSQMAVYSTFLLGSLIFAYARFDFVHLQPALPFVAILSAIFISKFPDFLKNNLLILYILCSSLILYNYHQALKSNETRFFGETEYALASTIDKYTEEGDPIFAMATTPHIYFLTKTRPSGNNFVFQFHWFMKEAESDILTGLINDSPKVVIRDSNAQVAGVNLVSAMPQINMFIEKNYRIVDKIGDIEILTPNESSN